MIPRFWWVKISQIGGVSPSVSVLSILIKISAPSPASPVLKKNWSRVWENNQFKCEGLKLPNTATVFCHASSSQWWHGHCPGNLGQGSQGRAATDVMNTVWWYWLTASRLIALHDELLPLTTHWVSWRCLPWLSSSCSGLAGPCHVPPFAH